jgi:hypothetical protein
MKLHNCFLALQWGGTTCGCPHDDLRLAVHIRPLTSGLWSHWGVGSASPITWSLHSETSDNVASLQKYKGIPTRQMKASLAPLTCLVSTHRVCYCYPFKWCLRLTPTLAPQSWGSTLMSWTYDHLAGPIPKMSPLSVGVEALLVVCLLLQKT